MNKHVHFGALFAIVASITSCSSESIGDREGAALDVDAQARAVEEDAVQMGAVETGDGWMSSTCSPLLSSEELWQMLDSGSHDLYVLNGLKVVGDQEVIERTGTGILESRALHVSIANAELAVDITDTDSEHALLFLEESRVFRSDAGSVFREQPCAAAPSVDAAGSLSSRVLAGSDRTVLLLVQSTTELGPVVRQVATVVGNSVLLADQQELPLQAIVEAASAIRRAR